MRKELRLGSGHPYDVIVCGAGHAGCEAALVAARMGASVLLLTGNMDTIAQMSCNPAIGGQAKGHIVREIDALGGEMGINADVTGIHYRLLNASRGSAVQAPRTQCDKKVYQMRMKHTIELQEGLISFQAMAMTLIYKGDSVVGVRTNLGIDFYAKSVIITTGTFLRGLMHVGLNQTEGGRMGDFSAKGLSESFLDAGIELERLKTGTPPRILGKTIDFSQCEEQPTDVDPVFFAFYDTRKEELFHVEQSTERRFGWVPGSVHASCWITYTNEGSHSIIEKNLSKSPLYSGIIQGLGPRYCPSIEDKCVRFKDKERHRIFLEPEGIYTNEWYINGLSTSLPFDVQVDLLRSIQGLSHVVMTRPAYAVEYDYAPPTQLYPTLESKKVEGLFFAGQINGTSGYEEAAGQGLIAGINAVCKTRNQNPLILGRHESYIGVLIDDLVTKGTKEPYRMFTSRAEYRLLLNHGSAEIRLCPYIDAYQLVPKDRLMRVKMKQELVEKWFTRIETEKISGCTFGENIRRTHDDSPFATPSGFEYLDSAIREEILYRVRYKGYLDREQKNIDRVQDKEKMCIPESFDFSQVYGLRAESREKLKLIKPRTLGQAARISGVTPADVSLLMIALRSFRPESAS